MANRTYACGQYEEHHTVYGGDSRQQPGQTLTTEHHEFDQCSFTMRRGCPLTYRTVRASDGTPISDWVPHKAE